MNVPASPGPTAVTKVRPAATPFTPRPRMLVALSCVMAVWVVALVVMYFRTVRPAPHAAPPTTGILNAGL